MTKKFDNDKERAEYKKSFLRKGNPTLPIKTSENIIPEEFSKIIYSHVPKILDNNEFFMYVNEIRDWTKDHPDWNLKEDIDDLNGIAMERVIQFRLLSSRTARKIVEIDKEYSNSKNREMLHRNNLGAKRGQRIIENKVTNITNNVVNIAGEIDRDRINKIKQINENSKQIEDSMFPVVPISEIQDAEIVEEENGKT